jgi:hypothetical protein
MSIFTQKFTRHPLRRKILGLLYSRELALQHSFNAAIGKLIQVRGAEISSEKCQILMVWFGYLMHVSEDISASRTQINLSIAALKQYNKPYI